MDLLEPEFQVAFDTNIRKPSSEEDFEQDFPFYRGQPYVPTVHWSHVTSMEQGE